MAIDPMKSFQVPNEMRKFAEQSVEQARQAFDSFMTATSKAVSDIEGRATAASSGVRDVSSRAVNMAQSNIAASFEFAQKLVKAKDVEEVLNLQKEYIQAQTRNLSEQAKELGEVVSKAAKDSTKGE